MTQQPKPLFSKDAEEAILGVVLLDPQRFPEIDLDPGDFYLDRNRQLWEAFTSLFAMNKGIDQFTIASVIGEKELAELGGPAYLTKLVAEAPLGIYAADVVERVKDFANRRKAMDIAQELARSSYDTAEKLDINKIIERLLTITTEGPGGAVQWGRYLSELYDEIVTRMEDPKDLWGLPTGFGVFDRITGGLQPGELLILSGKPGEGKSLLAMQIAKNLGGQLPGAIYSAEMSGLQVVRRTVSETAGVPTRAMKTGKVDGSQMRQVTKAIGELSALPIYMDDNPYITTAQVRADLVRLKAQHNIGWFVFDYMLLAQDSNSLDEIQRTAILSRNFKLICRHLNIPGMVIHSMNKEGMGAINPGQHNLRGSGQVSYDSDLIVFLTDFQVMSPEDRAIPAHDIPNLRTMVFGKGRELEDPKKYFHLVKRLGFPAFGDYYPERRIP